MIKTPNFVLFVSSWCKIIGENKIRYGNNNF